MSEPLSPIVSEFESEEQEASYDRWFRAKIQAAIDSKRPRLPHDQVTAEILERLNGKRLIRKAG
ncbi:MAG: stability determinant [Rhodospirillales bacterium]|nr:stability determinant [Rhodospirillales bacterium]